MLIYAFDARNNLYLSGNLVKILNNRNFEKCKHIDVIHSNLYLAGNLVYVSRRNLSQTFATNCIVVVLSI